jgi:heme oxygenase
MGISTAVDTSLDTAAGVLCAARDRRRAADLAEADLLALAVDWAAMHPADSIHEPATHTLRGFGQTDLALAGEGAPTVAEYAVPELAAALGLSTEAGKRYLGEAL